MKKVVLILGSLLIGVFSLVMINSAQAVDDIVSPSVPSNLSASPVSASQINLSWVTSTDNVGVTGYSIFRNGLQIANTTNTVFYNIGLTASTTYSYTIKAYDGAGNASAHSTSISATTLSATSDTTAPSAPTNLTANAVSFAQISLAWNTSTDNVAVTGYAIFRDNTEIANIIGSTFNDLGLTASTTYSYTVKAYDGAGNRSNFSNTASATTLATSTDNTAPSAPTNLTANPVSASQINLSWTTSTDNVGVTGYSIFRNNTKIANVTTNTYHNTGLTASTTYSYTIKAYDGAGNTSANSNTATATTYTAPPDTTVPTAPSQLKAHVVSYKHVNLKWKAPADKTNIAGYAVFKDGVQIAKVKRPHFNNIRLNPGTTYTFTVKAYDKDGDMSAASNTITVTTKARKAPKYWTSERHDDDSDDDDDKKYSQSKSEIIKKINKNIKKIISPKNTNNKGKNK
ncbi:MAG: hypothetical protein A2611_02750 [Candidatus Komeilibacteria bacterium RIFOXYD1_FULL_37_29]|nr:MAG: hypothetical protein A2611_02750 [Candidatus Komeilibacteria bacterium RIFOXYD1_FULL_37_29]